MSFYHELTKLSVSNLAAAIGAATEHDVVRTLKKSSHRTP